MRQYWLTYNVELERDKLVDLNNLDFALRSNSTACKIKSPRPNASVYNPGNGPG